MINLGEGYLLMIEPKEPATEPIIDIMTRMVTAAYRSSIAVTPWRGWHTCVCGAMSDNTDHELVLMGQVVKTNSLCIHYVACHRGEIPVPVETRKLAHLMASRNKEAEPTKEELMGKRIKRSEANR